jgi:AraC-like DNA-binding protein
MQVIESIGSHQAELRAKNELTPELERRQERKTLTLVLQGLKLQRTLLERRFKQTFERERTLLLSGSAEDFESGIWLAISLEQAERVLEHDRGQIEALLARCREFAKAKLDEIDLLLAREDRLLDEQRAALTLAEARAKRAIGQLTGRAIESTRQHVISLLMRSDMGLLDVAWWQKEQLTAKIDGVLTQSNDQRRIFERDMKIIMQER